MANVYKTDLEQGILTHDCISFDLFDTLIMRRVPTATDVYAMVEQRISPQYGFSFCELRVQAEKSLQSQGIAPTFAGIYEQLRQLTGISEEDMLQMMQEEQSIESEVWLARRDVAELLRAAHDSGKLVTVLADTYMSGPRIRELLHTLEIDYYDHLLSAADVGLTRETGLYAYYRDTVGDDKRLLHIGDNPLRDGTLAQENGIDSLLISRAWDQYRRDNAGATLPQELAARRILGEKIARQYNSPFA